MACCTLDCSSAFPSNCCEWDCVCSSCGETCRWVNDVCIPYAPQVDATGAASSYGDPESFFRAVLHSKQLTKRLGEEVLAYAMTHGITMLKHTPTASTEVTPSTAPATQILHAPLTLLPLRFPAATYQQLQSLVVDLNEVYERVARDENWLRKTLALAASKDEFLARLLRVLDDAETQRKWKKQKVHLALNRSDYLMHAEEKDAEEEMQEEGRETESSSASSKSSSSLKPLQVEFNTISAGAGSLSNQTAEMHRFLVERYMKRVAAAGNIGNGSQALLKLNLPPNAVIDNLTNAMSLAHTAFLAQIKEEADLDLEKTETVVLFIVQPNEANMADQRLLEYTLFSNHNIPVVRLTLSEVHSSTRLDEQGRLWVRADQDESSSSSSSPSLASDQLVSLLYFRAGYTPRDFPSDQEWASLTRLEASRAVKCPSVAYHLAGCKKIQQVLSEPGLVERFSGSRAQAERVRSVFTGMAPAINQEAREAALERPRDFVLKPQREGGGNNLWGEEMVAALKEKSREELQGFILMKTIKPPQAEPRSALKFGRVVEIPQPLSELGMMGACLSSYASSSRTLSFLHNSYLGYLLRTKDASLNEGGLMSGAGAIDSLVLV